MNAILASNPAALPTALVDRAAMQKAVETILNATEKRTTYPILANARLTGDGSTLFVSGTDLDMEIVVAIPAAADAGLDMTLPAHLLKDLLKGAPKTDMVAFAQPEERDGDFLAAASIEFESVDYQVNPLHPDSWPEFKAPGHNSARRFALTGTDFLAALDATAFAISTEETRYYLNGVFMTARSRDGLTFVATDGHRLSKQVLDMPDGAEGLEGVILPRKLVSTLQKLWKGKNTPDQIEVMVDEARIQIQFADVTITSKVIDGTFPDYERVTPKHNDKPMTVSIAALQEAIKAVSVIASERGGKAVKFEIGGHGLTLSVLNHDAGRAVTTIDAEVGFDDGLEIGFNAKYLDDFLKNVKGDSETISFNFSDMAGPAVVTCDRDGWLGVQMPMRV